MTQFETLLTALKADDVAFVIIGGVAASFHGSARVTNDLDIVYERSDTNYQRLVHALVPFEPYLRGAPPGLPFRWDAETIKHGLNFTLRTRVGDIDLLGELAGVGSFRDVVQRSIEEELLGGVYRIIDLETLIRSKRAAGRSKDLEVIAELEAIREELSR